MISKNALMKEADRFILDMQSNQQRYIDFLSTMGKYLKMGMKKEGGHKMLLHCPPSFFI